MAIKDPHSDTFEAWWNKEGRFLDPDTEDVSWYDKRKGLAEYAYAAGFKDGKDSIPDLST